jgi:hypothetical protein
MAKSAAAVRWALVGATHLVVIALVCICGTDS